MGIYFNFNCRIVLALFFLWCFSFNANANANANTDPIVPTASQVLSDVQLIGGYFDLPKSGLDGYFYYNSRNSSLRYSNPYDLAYKFVDDHNKINNRNYLTAFNGCSGDFTTLVSSSSCYFDAISYSSGAAVTGINLTVKSQKCEGNHLNEPYCASEPIPEPNKCADKPTGSFLVYFKEPKSPLPDLCVEQCGALPFGKTKFLDTTITDADGIHFAAYKWTADVCKVGDSSDGSTVKPKPPEPEPEPEPDDWCSSQEAKDIASGYIAECIANKPADVNILENTTHCTSVNEVNKVTPVCRYSSEPPVDVCSDGSLPPCDEGGGDGGGDGGGGDMAIVAGSINALRDEFKFNREDIRGVNSSVHTVRQEALDLAAKQNTQHTDLMKNLTDLNDQIFVGSDSIDKNIKSTRDSVYDVNDKLLEVSAKIDSLGSGGGGGDGGGGGGNIGQFDGLTVSELSDLLGKYKNESDQEGDNFQNLLTEQENLLNGHITETEALFSKSETPLDDMGIDNPFENVFVTPRRECPTFEITMFDSRATITEHCRAMEVLNKFVIIIMWVWCSASIYNDAQRVYLLVTTR